MDSTDETLPGSVPTSSAFSLQRGDLVSRYVIVEKVGMGGMGAVYAAYDPDLDRRIAIKVLHASEGPSDSSSATQRLLREAQAMARLSHPNVVSVLDVGRHSGEVFVAMEFVDGQTLGEWVENEDPPPEEVLRVFADAALGLEAAHEGGLVHRDFKPSNVMLDRRGRVFVMDLGLARLPGRGAKPPIELLEQASAETTVEDLTRTGALMGTPAYMSPEQYLGQTVDPRSDQFSFFVALHEALYGQRPFRGDSPAALAFNVTQGELATPNSKSGVPSTVHKAIVRGLDVDPEKRFPDMRSAREAITPKARRTLPIALGVAAAAVLAATAFGLSGEEESLACAGASAAVSEAWSEEQREKIRSAFDATGIGIAPEVATRAIAELDERAEAWSKQRTSACEATHVFKEQSEEALDLRIACLNGRLSEFEALVGVLQEADVDTVGNTARALSSLKSLDDCADVERLLRGIEPAPEVHRARVEELRETLDRARMLDETGRYPAGLSLATPLLEEAQELEYVPLIVETQNILGSLTAHVGDWAGAEEFFEASYFAAMGGVHPEAASRASITLIKVTGSPFAMGRREEGIRWAQHAEGALRRVDDGGFLEAQRLDALGHIQSLGGDRDAAIEHLAKATKMLEELQGDSYYLANAMNDYAYALEAKDRHDEAIAALERSIEIEEAVVGEEHPLVATTYGTLGATYINMKRYEEGERVTLKALGILERSVGPDHPNVSSMVVNLADLYSSTDREAEAIPLLERAVAIRSKAMGPGHPIYLWTLHALSKSYMRQQRFEDALATAERALRERGELPTSHRHVLNNRIARAEAMIGLGRASEVLESLERELTELPSDTRPYNLADVRRVTGMARIATGSKKSGLELVRQARSELPEGDGYAGLREEIDAVLGDPQD